MSTALELRTKLMAIGSGVIVSLVVWYTFGESWHIYGFSHADAAELSIQRPPPPQNMI